MNKFVLIAVLTLFTSYLYGQNGDVVSSLAVKNQKGASVSVTAPSGLIKENKLSQAKVKGYRVRIYFDNSQDARDGSAEAKMEFEKLYPDTPTFVEYAAPYFKVTAGNFLSREEAVVLWGNVLSLYPNAFVVTESIPLSEFTNGVVLSDALDDYSDDFTTEMDRDLEHQADNAISQNSGENN